MSTTENDLSFGSLPDDLKDLPASDPKVQAFFRTQATAHLATQRDQYEARLADATRPPAVPPKELQRPTNADWFQDPNAAVTRVAPTREEFAGFTAQMQRVAISNAEMTTKQKFAKDWSRFEKKVKTIMSACDPSVQADPANWDTAYYAAKGTEADQMVAEAETRTKTVMSGEGSTPPAPPEAPKAPLTAEQKTIIQQLGLTEDKYRQNAGRVTQWAPRQ